MSRWNRSLSLHPAIACCIVAFSSHAVAQQAPATTELDVRSKLDAMMEKLERKRQDYHVAGLGIAVVHNGEVILCDGLGEANIESQTKATGDTIFAIGSSTKAFTTTVIASLVDEGKMDWDASVHEYLPNFHVFDKDADEKITIRDLVCHRTGLSRMGLLWASGKLSREEILAAVAGAEPSHTYGKDFNYSNINFIAAGEAAAAAGGASWETLTRDRLIKPLKMVNTSLSALEAKKHPKMATGYYWDDIDNKQVIDPMRVIDVGGAAGSINSSARDMANWLIFQLAKGAFEGTQLVSAEQIEETHTMQIEIQPPYGYGLGWMVGEFQGHKVIEHGGNIDGFSAQVAFLPDLNLGYVLLTNASFTALQNAANGVVLGSLLDGASPSAGEDSDSDVAAEDLTPYVGTYIANFAMFKDARFTVENQDGTLTVDVPGQMAYELRPPGEDGWRPFAITDTIKVKFERDEAGNVTMLKMHQNSLTFECPREGVEIAGDVTLDDVRDLLGTYDFEMQDVEVKVLMQNGRLAVDVPGQMIFELRPPGDDEMWVFRTTDDIKLKFNRGEDGDVESLTMYQAGMEMVMPRVGSPDPAQTATLEDVMALHNKAIGTAQLDAIKTLNMSGTIRFVNQNVGGTINTMASGLTHYRNLIDLGRSGRIIAVVAGETGWSGSSLDPTEALKGKYLRSTQRMHPLLIAADWRDFADAVELEGIKPYLGRPHYAVHIALSEDFTSTAYVDVETGLVSGEDLAIMARGLGALPMKAKYSDYRDVGGIMLPFHVELKNSFHGKAVIQYDEAKVNAELPKDAFSKLPDQVE